MRKAILFLIIVCGVILSGRSQLIGVVASSGKTESTALTDHLISYYRFNDDVTDEVGSHNGTANNITYSTGKSGNGAHFTGSDGSNVEISDHDDFSFTNGSNDLPFSISFFMDYDVAGNSWFVSKRLQTYSGFEWQFISYSNILYLSLSSGTGTNQIYIETSTSISSGWHHIVGTYDGSETKEGLTIYIDGSDVSGTTTEDGTYTGMVNSTGVVRVGDPEWSTNSNFDGIMDGLGIWDKELTSSEVTTIYNTQNGGSELK